MPHGILFYELASVSTCSVRTTFRRLEVIVKEWEKGEDRQLVLANECNQILLDSIGATGAQGKVNQASACGCLFCFVITPRSPHR